MRQVPNQWCEGMYEAEIHSLKACGVWCVWWGGEGGEWMGAGAGWACGCVSGIRNHSPLSGNCTHPYLKRPPSPLVR